MLHAGFEDTVWRLKDIFYFVEYPVIISAWKCNDQLRLVPVAV